MFETWDHYSYANVNLAIVSVGCEVGTDNSEFLFLPSTFFLGHYSKYIMESKLLQVF